MHTGEAQQEIIAQSEPFESQADFAASQAENCARIVGCFLGEQMNYRAQLQACLRLKSVVHGTVKLSSGEMSNYYIDCKRTTLDPHGAILTGHAILDILKREHLHPQAIGGPTVGADPIVTATAAVSYLNGNPLPGFFIRKDRKTHGLQKQIEGIELKRGLRVVIVDEVCTKGESTLDAIDAAEREGLEIIAVLSLVDREQGGSQKIRDRGYPYFPVFTAKQLLEDVSEESGASSETPKNTGAPTTVHRRSA